ncbi:hypothetical protein NC651_021792 [Populus alba x Populus x berolinensis]|nr:hypothetical protein NC651_021792 [Populus alba x Populus x berolinensis]
MFMVKEELETAFTVILHVKPLGLSHVEKEKKKKERDKNSHGSYTRYPVMTTSTRLAYADGIDLFVLAKYVSYHMLSSYFSILPFVRF